MICNVCVCARARVSACVCIMFVCVCMQYHISEDIDEEAVMRLFNTLDKKE